MIDFLNQIFDIASPATWPRWLRRFFLCLSPITIPLLILFWIGVIVTVIGAVVAGLAFAVVMEAVNALADLWD
jgi:hypothetical protein